MSVSLLYCLFLPPCSVTPVCLSHLVFLGFPLSGDQSLGSLWSNRLSDRTHRLFHRHRGGGTGWDKIPSGQREYPEELHKIHLVRQMGGNRNSVLHILF